MTRLQLNPSDDRRVGERLFRSPAIFGNGSIRLGRAYGFAYRNRRGFVSDINPAGSPRSVFFDPRQNVLRGNLQSFRATQMGLRLLMEHANRRRMARLIV